jgi:hypothetical protein
MVGINTQTQTPSQLTISRAVFTALNPLDQIAARACEKCGLAQIVDDDVNPTR